MNQLLNEAGWKILRIWESKVLENVNAAADRVEHEIIKHRRENISHAT